MEPVPKRYEQRSSIALGIGVVLLVCLFETVAVHQTMPNPPSPLVWTVLGLSAAMSIALGLWYRRKAAAAGP